MSDTIVRRLTGRDARLSNFRFYDLLVHIFVVVLLISNLVGQKICAIPLFNFRGESFVANISGAQLLFPITYIFGDIFTEVYGYGASRRAIWLGFLSCAILALMGLFVVWIPAAPNWPNQPAFEAVFYNVPRFIAASLIAFWLGEFTNSYTLAKMKLWTDGKWLWTRTVGSTVTGQFVDTAVVILIAFGGRTAWSTMLNLIISGYVGKVLYEVLATPLTYFVVNKLKRAERVDVYDRDTNFSPFARAAVRG
ncbi:MAG: queuosine precursor transporter [Chthoniobacterales bacterium]